MLVIARLVHAKFKCPSLGFFPDPLTCTAFYRCVDLETSHKYICPLGTRFDPTLSNCNHAHLAPDCHLDSPTPTTATQTIPTTSQTTKSTSRKPSNDCGPFLGCEQPDDVNLSTTVTTSLLTTTTSTTDPSSTVILSSTTTTTKSTSTYKTSSTNTPSTTKITTKPQTTRTTTIKTTFSTPAPETSSHHLFEDLEDEDDVFSITGDNDSNGPFHGENEEGSSNLSDQDRIPLFPPHFPDSIFPPSNNSTAQAPNLEDEEDEGDSITITGDNEYSDYEEDKLPLFPPPLSIPSVPPTTTKPTPPTLIVTTPPDTPEEGQYAVSPTSLYPCKQPGYYSETSSCKQFYVCREVAPGVLSSERIFRCPKRYLFDPVTRLCQREYKVNCQGRQEPVHYLFYSALNSLIVPLEESDLEQFFSTPLVMSRHTRPFTLLRPTVLTYGRADNPYPWVLYQSMVH